MRNRTWSSSDHPNHVKRTNKARRRIINGVVPSVRTPKAGDLSQNYVVSDYFHPISRRK